MVMMCFLTRQIALSITTTEAIPNVTISRANGVRQRNIKKVFTLKHGYSVEEASVVTIVVTMLFDGCGH